MEIKINIDEHFPKEKAEFWLKKMSSKIDQITKELKSEQDFLWGYKNGDAYEIEISQIYVIQVENEKTMICTQDQNYVYRGRLYQVQNILSDSFVMISRGTIVNYHFIDHLEIISTGSIDAVLENGLRVQVSRRRIKNLKERLGL